MGAVGMRGCCGNRADSAVGRGMKAPWPWFGGKSRAASLIWERFGDVPNYIEPFAGSLAVLLNRPHWPFDDTRIRVETVNDLDAYIVNFWRAIAADPEAVAINADNPVFECDLHARHQWLHGQAERIERIKSDPDFCDARVAGYWAWGLSSWIGDNFCRPNPNKSVPHLGAGKGVNRQLPHLGDPGKGVNARGIGGQICADRLARLAAYFQDIADRLRFVRVCCGDWRRVLTPSVTTKHGPTGILLDPPYGADDIDDVYHVGTKGIADACREWAAEHGTDPLMRIALCGYDGEHDALLESGWSVEAWKSGGGYANQTGKMNGRRERIWFSPACVQPETKQRTLFEVQP